LLPMSRSSSAGLLAALLLGGCGGSGHGKAAKQLTVPAYAGYPAITIPVRAGAPELCRRDAVAFTRNAVRFIAPSTLGTALEADEYYFRARLQYFHFKARLCDVAILRRALSRRLTAKQRRELVARFSFLGEAGHEIAKTQRD
jgi:hypothetical protein